MEVLYDFQERYKNIAPGPFAEDEVITGGLVPAKYTIESIEDVKSLCISEREDSEAGIYIHLDKIEGLRAGDRITITGRVGEASNVGIKWGVALLSSVSGPLMQETAPHPLFALTHILEERDIGTRLSIYSIAWGGASEPTMDVYIDGIVITRHRQVVEDTIDPRDKVYSFAEDTTVEPQIIKEYDPEGENDNILRSGEPNVRVFMQDDVPIIYVSNRVNDWDGVEFCVGNLKLLPGNRYRINVKIKVDGPVPSGTIFMIQGVPGFDWRGNYVARDYEEFTITHVMSRVEVEKWCTVRIATTAPGAGVSFYILAVEILRE